MNSPAFSSLLFTLKKMANMLNFFVIGFAILSTKQSENLQLSRFVDGADWISTVLTETSKVIDKLFWRRIPGRRSKSSKEYSTLTWSGYFSRTW